MAFSRAELGGSACSLGSSLAAGTTAIAAETPISSNDAVVTFSAIHSPVPMIGTVIILMTVTQSDAAPVRRWCRRFMPTIQRS